MGELLEEYGGIIEFGLIRLRPEDAPLVPLEFRVCDSRFASAPASPLFFHSLRGMNIMVF